MTSCRSCARGLDPSWKFCVYCGTPVAGTADGSGPAAHEDATLDAPALVPALQGEPRCAGAEPYRWTSAQPSTWPGEPMQPAIPSAIRPDTAAPDRPFSVLAIVAFVLSLVGFAPAFVLGHVASSRVRAHGLRGGGLALAATVIGYVLLVLWLAAIVAAAVWLLRSEPAGTIQQAAVLLLMRP